MDKDLVLGLALGAFVGYMFREWTIKREVSNLLNRVF